MKKRNVLAVLLGFLIIVFGQVILAIINFSIYLNVARSTGPSQLMAVTKQSQFLYLNWLMQILGIAFILLGGGISAWVARKKGWFYGGLSGLAFSLIFLVIAIITFVIPASFIYPHGISETVARNNQLNLLINSGIGAIKYTLLATLGGLIGEKVYKLWSK